MADALVADPLIEWAVLQQEVAGLVVERNKAIPVTMRGCRLCGRVDTRTVYRFGMADQCVCADREACAKRQEELWT